MEKLPLHSAIMCSSCWCPNSPRSIGHDRVRYTCMDCGHPYSLPRERYEDED